MILTRFVQGAALAAGLSAAALAPSAQLSGNYTVDPNGAGPNNFTSMSAAVGALGAGVSGPVTFTVQPATYQGLLVLTPVNGASSINTISFVVPGSTPATLDANGSSLGILGFDAAWFRFNNFKVNNFTNYGMYLFGISSPGSNNNVFTNVEFDAPATTSSTVRCCYFQSSYFNTFNQCKFRGGAYCLYHSQCSSNTYDGCTFDGKGSARYCVYLINNNDSDNLFQNCFIHDCSSTGYGLYVNASQYGNMFWHNTVIVNATNSAVWAGNCCAWSRACSYRNNIFVNMGSGSAMKYGCNSSTLDYNDFDYNCYYAPNTTTGTVEAENSGIGFTGGTLAAWKTFFAANQTSIVPTGGGTSWDQNSVEGDPMLISLMAPYDIHLQPGSPLIDAGTTNYIAGAWISFPASTVATDIDGEPRGLLVDIGADEDGARLTATGTATPGGTVNFTLSSTRDPGLPYQVVSSLGTGPIPIGTRSLGLSLDNVFSLSLKNLAPTIFQNYAGVLVASGRGTAAFAIPNIAQLRGIVVYHAFVTISGSAPQGVQSISNTVATPIN